MPLSPLCYRQTLRSIFQREVRNDSTNCPAIEATLAVSYVPAPPGRTVCCGTHSDGCCERYAATQEWTAGPKFWQRPGSAVEPALWEPRITCCADRYRLPVAYRTSVRLRYSRRYRPCSLRFFEVPLWRAFAPASRNTRCARGRRTTARSQFQRDCSPAAVMSDGARCLRTRQAT